MATIHGAKVGLTPGIVCSHFGQVRSLGDVCFEVAGDLELSQFLDFIEHGTKQPSILDHLGL